MVIEVKIMINLLKLFPILWPCDLDIEPLERQRSTIYVDQQGRRHLRALQGSTKQERLADPGITIDESIDARRIVRPTGSEGQAIGSSLGNRTRCGLSLPIAHDGDHQRPSLALKERGSPSPDLGVVSPTSRAALVTSVASLRWSAILVCSPRLEYNSLRICW